MCSHTVPDILGSPLSVLTLILTVKPLVPGAYPLSFAGESLQQVFVTVGHAQPHRVAGAYVSRAPVVAGMHLERA